MWKIRNTKCEGDRSTTLSRRKRVMFILALLMIGFGLAELSARAVDRFTGISLTEHRARYRTRQSFRLGTHWASQRGDYPYLPFVPNPNDPRVNTLGFRGADFTSEKPPDTYRIVCMGGSTTWDEYPEFLQRTLEADFAEHGLKLEVINGGNVFWTSMETQINFITRCLPLRPDAIIIYHGINDAIAAFGDTHSFDYSHWRGRLEKNEPVFWDHLPLWLDRSAAFAGLRAIFERQLPAVGWNEMTMKYAVRFDRDAYNGVEPYRQNLYNIISLARSRGIETFLCTAVFNDEYQYKYSLKRWGDAVADNNAVARWYSQRWDDVHLIDVAISLEGGNDWMTDMCHFTAEGKRRIAGFVADHVRTKLSQLVQERCDPMDVATFIPPAKSALARQ